MRRQDPEPLMFIKWHAFGAHLVKRVFHPLSHFTLTAKLWWEREPISQMRKRRL